MLDDAGVQELARLLCRAERAFVLTGAGISTRSNIPDFRGPDGVFRTRSPVTHQEFVQSDAARREYWAFKLEGYEAFRVARPNDAHRALVELERRGRLAAVVTQNVDGLHQAAGTSLERLIELHGTNAVMRCDACPRREAPERCFQDFRRSGEPPTCPDCRGWMRPAVVMFGEALCLGDLERARELSEAADLILALGSSLTVTPAADLPLFGARRGTPYVIINRGETPHDGLATLRLDADVSDILPRVAELV